MENFYATDRNISLARKRTKGVFIEWNFFCWKKQAMQRNQMKINDGAVIKKNKKEFLVKSRLANLVFPFQSNRISLLK